MRRPTLAEIAVGFWCAAFFGTAVSIQSPYFGQQVFAESTAWAFNRGWQNEIAAFDFALALIMLVALRAGIATRMLLPLLVLGLLLGANHLTAALEHGRTGNWVGTVFNACGLALVVAALVSGRRAGR